MALTAADMRVETLSGGFCAVRKDLDSALDKREGAVYPGYEDHAAASIGQ